MNASLEVELSSPEAVALAPRLQALALAGDEPEAFFAVTASHVAISSGASGNDHAVATTGSTPLQPVYAAVFLPPTLTESALDGSFDFINPGAADRRKFSKRLLAMVHPFMAGNFSIKGILHVRNSQHAPADIALVDLQHTPTSLLDELLQTTNGQVIHAGPELILKVLVIYSLCFVVAEQDAKPAADAATTSSGHGRRTQLEIPSCPVCIHRIDPIRLGLPKPGTSQMCSKFCEPPNLLVATAAASASAAGASSSRSSNRRLLEQRVACSRQRLLLPWPSPCHCVACRRIDQYWQAQVAGTTENNDILYCGVCHMQQTLWICLTCGFLGCGRYSNKHAADHFVHTGHPFSLELATLRIWDYVTGGFVQRTDLLECPSAWPLLQPWMATPLMTSSPVRPTPDATQKAPKKATMIGEEYEILIQSALEEQAQHYEGELSHLLAQLTAEHVDKSAMTAAEAAEVEALQAEMSALKMNIDRVSRELLDAQAQEAAHRATSANLLRQQQVAQDVVQKLEQETAHERAVGRQQVEELEQQIADLQANQRMRHQFTENEELQQAQIWGMTTTTTNTQSKSKKGKKQRRVRK